LGQFRYVDNNLLCEDTPLIELAEEFGTPLYVYSKNQILENYRLFNAATSYDQRITICYAVKANSNPAILKMLAEEGAGADVVSAGELSLTLQAGFPAEKISFSGVGKTEEELEYAIKHNIACINAESIQELQLISRIGLRLNKYVRVTLRFNPDVDAESHPNITTGLSINKFGLEGLKALEYFDIASKLPNIVPIGIHTHIGSQITKTEPFIKTAQFIVDTIKKLREAGFTITHIDFGGGFGVRYINALTHEALPKEPNGAEVPSAKGFTDSFLTQLL
jgi:diaminopimelate decarboxylase